MENKAHALAAGIFVLVAAALLGLLAVWLSTDNGKPHRYEISTREPVSGLQPQAPVRLRGVDVGKVTKIAFDPQTPGNVLLELDIDEKAPLTQATFATLDFQGVTGLAFVQLDDGGVAAPTLVPNDAQPPRIVLKPGLLAKLAAKGEALLDKTEQISARLNELLGPDNQKRVASALDNIGQAAGSAQQLATRLDNTLVQRVDPLLARLPALADDTGKTIRALQTTGNEVSQASAEFGKTMRRLNEKDGPLDRLAEGTQALSAGADSFNNTTLPRVNRVTDDTSRAARQLSRTVNNINDNPQSLIFGNGVINPGPGEPGFAAPGARP